MDFVKNIPVSAHVRIINGKAVIVGTETADIPREDWNAFWQRAFEKWRRKEEMQKEGVILKCNGC